MGECWRSIFQSPEIREVTVFLISNLGEITPHLLILPTSSTTIFCDLWSSMISNSPMYPCFYMTLRNLTTTLETGPIKTCFLPAFSALTIVFKQSASTFTLTILRILKYLLLNLKFQFLTILIKNI